MNQRCKRRTWDELIPVLSAKGGSVLLQETEKMEVHFRVCGLQKRR